MKFLNDNIENQDAYNSKFSKILEEMGIFDGEDENKTNETQNNEENNESNNNKNLSNKYNTDWYWSKSWPDHNKGL